MSQHLPIVSFLALSLAATAASAQEWHEGGKLLLRGDVVTLNERADVLRGASVLVEGAHVTAVIPAGAPLPAAAAAASVVDVAGYIFPGLIDAHNHLEYDMLPEWDVP